MFTVIRKTVIGKTVSGKTASGKSHTNKEHKNKENKNKEKREKSNALFENWFIECAYRFDAAFRKIVILRYRFCGAKRPWLSLWESWLPLWGRLRVSRAPIHASNPQTEYPLSQPVRLTALPKGEPRALPRQYGKFQFAVLTR